MSSTVDLFRGDYQGIRKALAAAGADNEELLDKILERCGVVAGDHYFLVNNEFPDNGLPKDWNPCWSLIDLLSAAFPNIEDAGMVLRRCLDNTRRSLVYWDEVAEELGIDVPETDDDHDED